VVKEVPPKAVNLFSLLGKCAMTSSTIRAFTCLIILTAVLLLFGCRDTEPEQQTALTAEMLLHLEDHSASK